MSESKELVLVTLPAAADLEEAFISDEYIDRLITDIRQKATSVAVRRVQCIGRGNGLRRGDYSGICATSGVVYD